MKPSPSSYTDQAAFTLIEVMLSTAIIGLLLLVLVSITESARKTWTSTTARAEEFRGARVGFEAITRRLSQATLNTYWDYFDATGSARNLANADSFVPARYGRQSELRFISGQAATLGLPSTSSPTHAVFFQAPLGFVADTGTYSRMENLLNTWGYFVQFGNDRNLRPPFVTTQLMPYRYRFRLMEMMQPSEKMTIYQDEVSAGGNSAYTSRDWFLKPFSDTPQPARVLADNIIALVLLPKLTPDDQRTSGYTDASLASNYLYDSTATNADKNLNPRHQLPPVVQVTMVAVEETSFSRFQKAATTMPSLVSSSMFTSVGSTTDPTKSGYAKDLQTLETTLRTSKPPLTYRIFSTNVSLKAAKWSREQAN